LSKLLDLAGWRPGRCGEQVLHWLRPLTPAERTAIVQYFQQLGYIVEWTNYDALKVR
jgi:hypothetical protein